MASVVDICNLALDKLGHSAIISLDDGNKAANICARTWPLVRDKELRDHPWNFSITRATLAPSIDAPDWGFTYKHPFPTDLIRLIEIRDLDKDDYRTEKKHILADDDVLYIRYIAQITDPSQYDALFVDAVAARMAFEMCESFNQSNPKKQAYWDEYEETLSRAKRADAFEDPPTGFVEDDWVTSRL